MCFLINFYKCNSVRSENFLLLDVISHFGVHVVFAENYHESYGSLQLNSINTQDASQNSI